MNQRFDPLNTPPGFTPRQWGGICGQQARADLAKIVSTALAGLVILSAIGGNLGGMILSGIGAMVAISFGAITLSENEAAALESYLKATETGVD
jgi:hypothetical protein